MARPPIIQKLRHGTLLTGRLYRWFVETWNWLSGYVDNLRGDFDANPAQGFITVDRSNPDFPIIRLRTDNLPAGGGSADGPFSPIYDDDGKTVTGLTNCYWMNGGKTILMDNQTIAESTTGFVCLRAGAMPSTNGSADIQVYATLAELQAAQGDPAYFIVPLYIMSESNITLDLRNIPHVYLGEIF